MSQLPGLKSAQLPGLEKKPPKVATSVGFFGNPQVDTAATKPVNDSVNREITRQTQKLQSTHKLPGIEDADKYPQEVFGAFAGKPRLPGMPPEKANLANIADVDPRVVYEQYPELVRKPEERGLLSETAAAALRGVSRYEVTAAKLGQILRTGKAEGARYNPMLEATVQPTRDDLLGGAANFAGESVPVVVAGTVSAPLVGVGFGVEGFTHTYERTHGNLTAATGAALLDAGLGLVPVQGLVGKVPGVDRLIKKLGIEGAQRVVTKHALEVLSSGAAGVAQNTGDELIARAGGAESEEFRPIQSALGWGVMHLALGGPRAFGELKSEARRQQVVKMLQDRRVISEVESKQLKNQPQLLATVVENRLKGHQVELVDEGGGKFSAVSKPDTVSWADKERLGHNEVLVQFERERRAAGLEPLAVDPSRLPPVPGEAEETLGRLTKLRDTLKSQVTPEEFTALGKPVTQRALVLSDLETQIARLAEPNVTRADLLRSEALENVAKRDKGSMEIIPEEVSSAVGKQKGQLISVTSDDMRPVQKYQFPLFESQKAGYLESPDKIAQDPKIQDRIKTIQRQTLEKLAAIQDSVKALPEDRLVMAKALDAEHTARVQKVLEKDSAPATSKARVTRALGRAKGPKTEALVALDRAYESIAKNMSEATLPELLDRLRDELKDAPQHVRDLVGGDRFSDVVAREQYLYGDNWPKTEQAVKRSVVERATASQRSKILEGLKRLDDKQRETFVSALSRAKDVKTIDALAAKIDLARQVAERQSNMAFLKRQVNKQGKNPRREDLFKLVETLRPPAKAKGQEASETNQGVAIKYDGKVYKGKVVNGLEETHADLFARIKDEVPDKTRFTNEFLDDKLSGFYTNKREFLTRDEAAALSKGSQSSTIEPSKSAETKSLVIRDPSTGQRSVAWREVQGELDKLSHDQLQDFTNQYRQKLRQGVIERGLYNKYFEYSKLQNANDTSRQIAGSKKLASVGIIDTGKHVAGLATDPVSFEGLAAQRSGFDIKKPLYRIFFGKMIDPMNRHLQNQADGRRFMNTALEGLGFKGDTSSQQLRASEYFLQPATEGFTKGEAMNAYALSGDEGRATDLFELGYRKSGRVVDPKKLIDTLTPADKQFVDKIKNYMQQNPMVEKAFSEFLLHNGYEPQRSRGWWASSRKPEETLPYQDFASFTNTIQRTTDNLRDRMEDVHTPFEARDFVSHFLRVHDKLSLYAELGRNLREAQETLYSPKVEETWNKHYGAASYNQMKLYLANLYGHVGHQQSAFDKAVNYTTSAYTVSKIALNLGSAAKQFLHLNTMLADGTLSTRALFKAMSEGAFASKDVGQRMLDNNGLAYLRYHGSFFGDLTNLAEFNEKPSKLRAWRDKSLVLQREADRAVMKVAWRAAELTAKQEGLTGLAANQRASELFNIAAGRDQPTSNPLYATELEVQAKRQPLLRGTLMFMREQNRIYNVVRRRVVESVQNPTPENLGRAGKALMFGVVANALGVLAINSGRRVLYNKPTDEKDVAKDTLESVTGMYYLGAPAADIAQVFYDPGSRLTNDTKSPTASMVNDLKSMIQHISGAVAAGDSEMRSGIHRGESKQATETLRALDSAVSLVAGVGGLPWAVWFQARNLYNWTRPEYKLLAEFEQARQRAKERPDSLEALQLKRAAERLNQIHDRRRSGLLGDREAREQIADELQQVLP